MTHNTKDMYATLDEALENIAGRSFYESARVRHDKASDSYFVENWHTGVEESVSWTYESGANVPSEAVDCSRTHESYESYETAEHIRFNLPDAVAMIEEGNAIGFTYVVADAECEEYDEELGQDCGEDHNAGWLLIATKETI